MSPSQMRVDVDGDQPWPVVSLTGEVDLSNITEITSEVQRSVRNTAAGLVLDLTRVTYLDSTGLRLIFQLCRELRDRQQELRLVVPDRCVFWPVLRLAGLPQEIRVDDSLSQALSPSKEDV